MNLKAKTVLSVLCSKDDFIRGQNDGFRKEQSLSAPVPKVHRDLSYYNLEDQEVQFGSHL